ncbi:MAG: hypothetical protein ACYC69_02625 [Thermodesulfovibrionales bacterium]
MKIEVKGWINPHVLNNAVEGFDRNSWKLHDELETRYLELMDEEVRKELSRNYPGADITVDFDVDNNETTVDSYHNPDDDRKEINAVVTVSGAGAEKVANNIKDYIENFRIVEQDVKAQALEEVRDEFLAAHPVRIDCDDAEEMYQTLDNANNPSHIDPHGMGSYMGALARRDGDDESTYDAYLTLEEAKNLAEALSEESRSDNLDEETREKCSGWRDKIGTLIEEREPEEEHDPHER